MFAPTSTRFLNELKRRRQVFNKPIVARLHVPPDLKWWYWQEFGTATRGETPYASGSAYPIRPINADYLKFPDPENKYGSDPRLELPESDGYARWFIVKAHPGIRPRRMVRQALSDIRQMAGHQLLPAIATFDPTIVRAVLQQVMEQAKVMIVESFDKNLPGNRSDGRLGGQSAADVFAEQATITIH